MRWLLESKYSSSKLLLYKQTVQPVMAANPGDMPVKLTYKVLLNMIDDL